MAHSLLKHSDMVTGALEKPAEWKILENNVLCEYRFLKLSPYDLQ